MITCAHTMRKNTISCLRTIRKNNDDLANTTYNYETLYRGNMSDIHNGMGDQYHIGMDFIFISDIVNLSMFFLNGHISVKMVKYMAIL